MPPRWLTLAIVGFWLLAMGWMTVREIAPRWRLGEPPPYTIDLTDEVSRDRIEWQVWQRGEKVGTATSSVQRLSDRTFELHSEIRFSKKVILFEWLTLSSIYRVDGRGELLSLKVELGVAGVPQGEIVGQVREGYLTPELRLGAQVFRGEKAKIPGSILNSMHLLSKISGLKEGQRWSIPLLDPLQFFSVGAPARSIPRLDAEVRTASLSWDGEDVACYLIEYREPDHNRVAAQTWVRRRDGLVLRHVAGHGGMDLLLEREPTK